MSALVEVFAALGFDIDTKKLDSADKKVQGTLDNWKQLGKKIAEDFGPGLAAGLFGKQAFDALRAVTSEDDRVAKLADSLNLGVQSLRALENAGSSAGVSVDEMRQGLQRLSVSLFDAQSGSDEAITAFRSLGLTELRGKDLEQILPEILDSFARMPPGIKRTATAIEIFGRGGARMLPFLTSGAAGLEDLKKRFAELGGVQTRDELRKSEAFNDSLTDIGVSAKSLKRQLLAGLIDPLTKFSKGAAKTLSTLRQWDEKTQLLSRGLLALGGALGTLALARAFIAAAGPVASLIRSTLNLKTALLGIGIAAAALALDDFTSFLAGDISAIGAALDGLFGAGAAEDWRNAINRGLADPIGEVRNQIAQLGRDWDYLKDKLTGGFKNQVTQIGNDFEYLADKAKKGLFGAGQTAWFADRTSSANPPRTTKTILAQASGPPSNALTGFLQNQLQPQPLVPNVSLPKPTLPVSTIAPGIMIPKTQSSVVTVGPTHISVTVPPGTASETANRVGRATSDAVAARHRAAAQALDPRR